MAKLSRNPRVADLARLAPDVRVLPASTLLFRVHFLGGRHPAQWNSFRFYGPVKRCRFDHQEEPPHLGPRGILYAATQVPPCIAEAFQNYRTINTRRRRPWLSAFTLTRDVRLLDLGGLWPTKAGASMAINSTSERAVTRIWSRAIYDAYPTVEGLYYCSSMHSNQPLVALYERAMDALPTNPSLSLALDDARLSRDIAEIAEDLGYRVVV